MANIVISKNGKVSTTDLIIEADGLDKITRYANMLAQSSMTPQKWQGKSIDCGMITIKALALGFNPMDFIQGVYEVKGKVGYESKLIIAMIHNSGLVVPRTHVQTIGDWDNIQFRKGSKFHGNEEGLALKVGFQFIGDSEITWGAPIQLSTQVNRNSALWETDTQTQLTYLAAKRWSNVYLPGVTMGMVGREELQDDQQPERDITPQGPSMVQGEVKSWAKAEVEPVEDQVDIEEVVHEEPAKEVKAEPVKAEPVKEKKARKPRKKKEPVVEAKEEVKKEVEVVVPEAKAETVAEPVVGQLVKAVSDEAIDIFGDEPFKPENLGKESFIHEGDEYFFIDSEDVNLAHFELVGEEAKTESVDLSIIMTQFKQVQENRAAQVEHNFKSDEFKAKATEVLAQWKKHTNDKINDVAKKGNRATAEDVDSLKEAVEEFFSETGSACKALIAEEAKLDNPF